MKRCPFCGAENHPTFIVCYNCGRALPDLPAGAADPSPTQPLHRRPGGASPAAPIPPPPGASGTQPMPVYRPAADNDPRYAAQPQNYPPQPGGYGQPVYPSQPQSAPYAPVEPGPPVQPPASGRMGGCTWPLIALGLGLVLLVACGLAVWTTGAAATGGISRLRAQLATQVVETFNGSPAGQAAPADQNPVVPSEPTPWPTFTPEAAPPTPENPAPEPTQPEPAQPEPAQTLDAAQQAEVDKLLSPGCRTALEGLGQQSDAVSQQPLNVLDDTWRANFTQAVTAMRENCGTLEAASPVPGQLGQVQQSLAQANTAIEQANQLWNQAVDNRDMSKVIDAAQHLGEAASLLNQALGALRAVGQ